MEKENLIQQKSYGFSIKIVQLYKLISREKKEYVLSKQILRSGTSIGANIEEAIGGVSRKDFINKLSISYKEARETKYWLRLLHDTEFIDSKSFHSMYEDCDEIAKIIYSIIRSSKQIENQKR
ncbi:MAG: four helix bundle protein [Bacteroidia bacterium]|nr:four helix bundle protein [Bacteroidia bacterium]